MTDEILLCASSLTRCFDDRPVLRGVNLRIGRGRICGLLGPNGAGKTTAINIITGLLRADSGHLALYGAPAGDGREAAVGVAPQEVALYPRLSCAENVAFFGGLYGLRGRPLRARVDAVIERARLSEYRDALVSTLSGGTRRRLNLAVAIVHDPALLILDEPTAGLDIEARFAVWDVIRGLRDGGAGVLLTTHLLDEAAALCDRIALLHEGVIAREGTLEELCATVAAAQVAEIEPDDVDVLRARAAALGLAVRMRGGRLALMLPQTTTLERLVERLRGTGLRSITLRPVGLEDVFFDLTSRGSRSGASGAGPSAAGAGYLGSAERMAGRSAASSRRRCTRRPEGDGSSHVSS